MEESQEITLDKKKLEHYILNAMEKWQIPGLSIAIVKDGETVLSKGYGTREIGQDLPVNEHTLFAITGATQSFTASAIALLVNEGKMDWNDRLIDLLPGFKTGNDLVTSHATVIDALANRTGLDDEMLSYVSHPNLSRTDLLHKMTHLQSSSEFRSQWSYNAYMHVAVGEVISTLTNKTWDDFIREYLFGPIGLVDTITGPHLLDSQSNAVTPHEPEFDKVIPVKHAESSNIGPAVSIYSSAADMAKWLSFQLNNGKVGNNTIIPENEIEKMRSNYFSLNYPFPGISKHFLNQGLGLLISDGSMGYKIYCNGGGTEGMESYHAFVPELNLGIAVMINARHVMPQPLIAWIIDRYTNAPHIDWVDQRISYYAKEREEFLSGLETSRLEITDSSKKPRLDLISYAGLYHHPVLGDLEILAENEKLSFILGTSYRGDFLHANNDTFFIKIKTPLFGKFLFSGAAQFRLDPKGKASSLFVAGKEFQKIK